MPKGLRFSPERAGAEPEWSEVLTDIHGVGPNHPVWVARRLREKRRGFHRVLGFHFSDWEGNWDSTVGSMAYVSRYTSNSANEMLDWDREFFQLMVKKVGEIITAENKSGKPGF
jgi:hypothetical protein